MSSGIYEFPYLFQQLSKSGCAKKQTAAGTYVGGQLIWSVNHCERKGMRLGKSGYTGEEQKEWRRKLSNPGRNSWSGSESRAEATAKIAEIPPELANCVADYAERLLEQRER